MAKSAEHADIEIEDCITVHNRGEQVSGGVTLGCLYPTYPNYMGEGLAGAARQVIEELI